jgi:hypothetical protein
MLPTGRIFFVLAASTALAQESPRLAPPLGPDTSLVLERAGRYVLDYEQAFRDLIAEELYTQSASRSAANDGPEHRQLRSDLVFVNLSGAMVWGCFRDVYEVDGQKVRERESRLEKLFRDPSPSAAERASAILLESARYNIGSAYRTINIPTLPLLFLHPQNQGRFRFERKGGRRIFGVEGVEVGFTETARPTLVNDGGSQDLPAEGRFWIDPDRGIVLRSEVAFRFPPARAIVHIAAEYRPEPGLTLWVPAEMKERYEDLPGAFPRVFHGRVEGAARYSNYRRFSVTTDEKTEAPR